MTNITSVSPMPKGKLPAPQRDVSASADVPAGEQTICAPTMATVLTLTRVSDGRPLPVPDGGVLGRRGDGGTFFEKDRTVSRRHAQVDFRDGAWFIEDLNSTNGTFLNGQRLDPGRLYLLNAGDVLSLSLACELNVI
jgi:hypothetical protein